METESTKRKEVKRPRRAKSGAKESGRKALALLTIVITLTIFAGAVMIFCLQSHSGGEKWIRIPAGSTVSAVRDSLRSALGPKEANRVYALWRVMRGTPEMAHGAYRVDDGCSSLSLARTLRRGAQTPVKVVFRGGRTIEDVARRVTSELECSEEEFLVACGVVLDEAGFRPAEYVAAFLPDTYEVYWTDSGGRLVDRLLSYRNRFWTDERRAKAADMGLTPVEVATVASIVEEETAKRDERKTVARLYLNRLAKGMLLQADPTVKFATGNPRLRRITSEHLKIDSPYNTYIYKGLPPGPIRVVESATLDAVLNAPHNNYIYMCAREDFSGYHNFASDYATHQENARRYHRELNRRGIR